MNTVDDALCRKMWYLGLFRSVRAYERLVAYITFKGYDYETEWTEMDLKERANFVRIIINHEDIHTSIHIDIDIYDDYKTKSIIASWEKYLNNLFNKKEWVEKCCGTCRYFKPDTTWCSEKCGNCYGWSSWESKEDKKMEQRCDNCRYFKLGVMEEPCVKCTLNGDVWSKWEPKEDKEMKRTSCTTCRYSEASAQEEPCKSCLGADGCYTYWEEPKEDKKMVEDLFEYTKKDVEEVTKAAEEIGRIWADRRKAFFTTKAKPEIKDVIFNGPATIVKWSDGTKTVVKAQKGANGKVEKIDKEKGLAMAIVKKIYGDNKGSYNDIFKKWID